MRGFGILHDKEMFDADNVWFGDAQVGEATVR